ncbi:hypothetical protein KP509_37G028900 [Ceratopteris richardii]|uniref:NADH dehydrogenase subunit 4L n=1 Tax=Ceratopteris richardii TaxID=49495 RepID=A0A8T2Q7F7_CERRI|nr:hypothetical protein KP509_37G028700 [Ceratopteris richardii]KAH7279661.1 hypothetical protein KP509_37G028900 [Ceratopteris richardii]
MGPIPIFLIVTLLTRCRSCMKCSFLLFLGALNHWFEYGADDGSRIFMAIFSFENLIILGT